MDCGTLKWSSVELASNAERLGQVGNESDAQALYGLHIQGFPRGCCGTISELMGDYLNTVGIGEFFYVCGHRDAASHAWLEVDALIVDIIGDQFDRPGIYVDKPDAWYGEWEDDIKHLAVHEPSAFFYGEERRFLEHVLEHINRMRQLGLAYQSKLTACMSAWAIRDQLSRRYGCLVS